MLRPVSLATVLVAVASLASACGSTTRLAAPRPLVIGALFSQTGSGTSIGPQQVNGARLAVAEINRAGGVDGAPLRLDVRDDRTDPATAVTQVRGLARRGAIAVLGPTLSIVALSADPVANQLHLPVLAVSNTIKGLVGSCAYPCAWSWRASLGEAVAVPADVDDYVAAAQPRSAAILYTTPDALGEQEADAAAAAFRRDGVTNLRRIEIPATTTDLRSYVHDALAAHPSVLFVGSSFATTMVSVLEAARGNGYRGGVLGGNVLNSDTTAALAGRQGVGAQSAAAWSGDNAFPANESFVLHYVQRFGAKPDEFAAQAYAGVQILAQAIERAHLARSTVPPAEQRALLQKALPDVALQTPLGPFRFTADHDVRQIVWIRSLDGRGGNQLVGFCNPGC
jgi:branched-chain amino acid transport system substrate-binding protein